MQERQPCGQSRDGLVCNRWRGHEGDHRGYNEQIDEQMFWSTTCRAVHSSGVRCELPEGHTVNHKGSSEHAVYQWPDNLDGPAGGARVCTQAEPRTTQSTGTSDAPIPLPRPVIEAIRTWARDDRLWSTQETTEFNLCTFARLVLKLQAADEGKVEHHYWTPDPTNRFCVVCGDNPLGSVWGVHRFQIQPSDPDFKAS